jgi:hypothetical protein
MASAGQPMAFAGPTASQATVAPLQDEARKRLQRYIDAPPVGYMPAALLQLARTSPTRSSWTPRARASSSTRTTSAGRAT